MKQLKWLAPVILVIGGALFFFNRDGAEGAAPSGEYQSALVDRGAINQSVATSGAVRPLVTVQVGSELSGRVEALFADFNSEVKIDQIIARIDPQTFQTRVAAARAEKAVAVASLTARKADYRRSNALLAQRKSDYDRFKGLEGEAGLSAQELDGFKAQYMAAQADVESARAQVANASAVVEQRSASLQQAEVDLKRTEIRSPIDGVVIQRSVDVGQTVAASLSAPILFEIAQDLSRIQIEADVNEADIGAIASGNAVTFTVDAYPGRNFTGEVQTVRLAPIELQNVVTYTVIINADNPGRILFPGMTATVEIITGQREDTLRIPNAATRFEPVNAEALLASAQADQGQPQRGRGGGGRFAGFTEGLDLSDEQQEELQKRMGALFAGARGGGGGGGNAGGDRRQKMQAIFRSVLTKEQWQTFEASQRNRPQRKTVWVLDAADTIKPRSVFLGLSDGAFTEIARGDLEEGDRVIIRKSAGQS